MSKNFLKIKNYFESGYWTKMRVRDAVKKERITKEEFKEITGENYDI